MILPPAVASLLAVGGLLIPSSPFLFAPSLPSAPTSDMWLFLEFERSLVKEPRLNLVAVSVLWLLGEDGTVSWGGWGRLLGRVSSQIDFPLL